MDALPPGWDTDIAVLELGGSSVEDRGDHPANPDFHWGNFLFVTDPAAVGDAERWTAIFGATFPQARWLAVGLTRFPEDGAAWAAAGAELEEDQVLTSSSPPRRTPVPDGYTVRRLDGDDWERYIARELAENLRTGEYAPEEHERFTRARTVSQRELSDRDAAAFFGAFHGERLVADLGIVRCGERARYQSVGTDVDHRGRGLASHLLGVAAAWAGERGCRQWVIVTESDNPAGRVYRRAGFAPDATNAQAYRPPPR